MNLKIIDLVRDFLTPLTDPEQKYSKTSHNLLEPSLGRETVWSEKPILFVKTVILTT